MDKSKIIKNKLLSAEMYSTVQTRPNFSVE